MTVLTSNVIVITIKGTPRHFGGDWKRTEPHPINAGAEMSPGNTYWSGYTSQGSGSLFISDDGFGSGNFTITRDPGQGYYGLRGHRDSALLIEQKPGPFHCGTRSQSPAKAAQPLLSWPQRLVSWLTGPGLKPADERAGELQRLKASSCQ